MAKQLQTLISAGFLKIGLITAFALASSLNCVGQNLKTGISERTQLTSEEVNRIFKAGFSQSKKTKPVNQHTAPNARMAAVQYLPLNSQVYYMDPGTGWVLRANARYTYDAQGHQTSFTQIPVISQQPADKDSSLYDVHGNLTFNAGYTFHVPSNSWMMVWGYRSQYTYDANGLPIEVINEGWDVVTGVWTKSSREVTTYNAAGYSNEQTIYQWQNNSWVPAQKYIFSFTIASNPPSGMITQLHNGSVWENQFKFKNLTWYDFDKGEHLNMESEMWMMNTWFDITRSTVVYNSFGGSVDVSQLFNGLTWDNYERITTTKNSKMHFTGLKEEEWLNNAWNFSDESQVLLTYNGLDQITEKIDRAWDLSSSTMMDNRRETFTNFLVMGTKNALPELTVNVYPNPVTDLLQIKLAEAENVQVTFTDLTGKLVLSQNLPAASNREINLSQLNKGTYLLLLETKKGKTVKKIIKN